MKLRRLILAANNAILANATEHDTPFAILQGDGFFVPYGTYRHREGMQHFDRAAADEMVAAHNSLVSKFKAIVTGNAKSYPVYLGHPDLPGTKDTDKKAYGWIDDIQPREDGVFFPCRWSDPGRELIENAHYRFYSPVWWTRKMPTGGIRPVIFKSMGLTNEPNIPVPALANEAPTDPTETNAQTNDMNPEILAALGLQEGATPEEVLAKITALNEAAAKAAPATDAETETPENPAAAETETPEGDPPAAKVEVEVENEAVTELEGRLRIAANAAVQTAVSAGRILPADAEAKVDEILAANDIATALADLGKLEAKFKTASTTGDLGNAKARLMVAANDEKAAAKAQREQLVANEFENTNPSLSVGERKRLAWRRAQAKKPELFATSKNSSGAAA